MKETKKHIKLIDKYIQENRERYKLLDEHFRDIKAVSRKDNQRKLRLQKKQLRTNKENMNSKTI